MANYYVSLDGTITRNKNNNTQKKKKPKYYVDASGNITENDMEDIAPTNEEERTWFQKGLFADGYQFGDISKSVFGSYKDIEENATAGILGMGEKAVDAGAYIAGGIAGALGADGFQKKMQGFIEKDLYDEEALAKKFSPMFGLPGLGVISDQVLKGTGKEADELSVFGEKTDSLAQSGGQLGATFALQAVGVPWWLTTGATSFGGEVETAFKEDATYTDAGLSGAITAGADILTEKLSGGIKFGGKTLDDVTLKPLTQKISNKAVRTLTNLGIDAVGEGSEEVIASVISNLGTALYKEESIGELLTSEEAIDEYIESFIGGAVLGGGVSSISAVGSAKSGRDYKTGLTENEQKVVEKEIENRIAEREASGNKVTPKEKASIEEQVKNDLQKGYINPDTIESVFGDTTYNVYNSIVEKETSLKEEINQLENMPNEKITVKQKERLEQARAELKNLEKHGNKAGVKARLSDEVQAIIAKDTFLQESYNEKARRSQAFEADLTKYDEKQQEVIRKAQESGILNNTNKTHEFVDMIAKISADKGVLFDFTDNKKLKESGFAVEGKTVNGYVKDGNIAVNINSNKALNTVVGHEITHILEGTDLYTELQTAVKEYATTKGEYDTRLQELAKLYEGVDNVNIENELTADLVGDYLFTDSDFISNLSAQKPNIFKKVYDEIKYLYKLATAGSKEARELEKVKRAFDKAYKETVGKEADSSPKYAMSEDANLLKFVLDAISNKLPKKSYYTISETISDKMASDIESIVGFSVKGYGNEISPGSIRHINNEHGANGTTDQSMKDVHDLARVSYVIDNYDNIREGKVSKEFRNSDGTFAKTVELQKKIDNGYYYVVEAVPDAKNKKLHIVSAYINKKDAFSDVLVSNDPKRYVQDEHQPNASFDDSIPQNQENATENVNTTQNEDIAPTKEQEEYFKDSVVRDENGKLKVMYHGTSKGGHTVFDPYGASKYGLFGVGSYFTDNKSVAESYTEKGKGNNKQIYETYLNITNPIDMDAQANPEAWKKAFPEADFPESGTNESFYRAMEEYFSDQGYAKWEASETALEVLESMGYDGITHIGGGRFNKADDTRHQVYIAFHPEQIKSITNQNPTDNPDINLSLSDKKQNIAPTGNYNVYGKDIALEAPMQSTVSETENVAPLVQEKANVVQDLVQDEYAPLTEAEANERDAMQGDRINTLNENDMPEEIEAPIYDEALQDVAPESPFDSKDIQEVGDRKQKAYMYENPEVKPFFQEEAQIMLGELRNSIKGEKSFNDQLYYDTNGEQGWFGMKRETSEQIAYMLDRFKYTYADIERGLKAIIEDHGAENNAISKRLEFMIDERLREGYTDFISGMEIPSNQGYINLLKEKQISEYSDEAYFKYLETLANEAPTEQFRDTTEMIEDIAPTKAYEAIEPEPENLDALEAQWSKNKMSRVDSKTQAEYEEIARVLDAEPITENERNDRKLAIFLANVFDKGIVFENLALKTKNRELMGKWNYTLYSESRAQRLMGSGDAEAGVKSLNDIRAEVENTGMVKQFYEYMYHKHNVDRMSLESKEASNRNRLEQEIARLKLNTLTDKQLMAISKERITEKTTDERKHLISTIQEYLKSKSVKNKPVFGYSVTAEASQEIVDQYEFAKPEFMDFAQDIYNYQNYLRQQLVDNGVISQETADLWSEMYPHYVPIRRIDSKGNNINVPLDTGRTGVNAPIKRATGGNTDILPLFDTMAMRTLQTYKATAKNSFGVELKNTLGTTVENAETNIDEVIDSIDTQESLLQEGKHGQKPTFTVFENGERVTFEITKDMYDAFKPLSDSSLLSKTIRPLNFASNFHRGLLTEYNPVFILTNGIKDIQDILINSQHPLRTYAKIPEAFAQLTGKGYWYNEYMNNGGDHNSYFDSDTNTFKTENKGLAKMLDLPPLSTISKLNNYIEMIPRLSEYIASREAGQSKEVSMLDSARVTTNFRAGGDLTKFLNRNGATFLNASVQGAMQQVRNVREAKANGLKGWANLATKFAIAGVPAFLLNALLWDDDEEYEELSDYVKQNYYIVGKYDDGKFIRIPKGRTVAVIQDAIKQVSDIATGNDEEDLKSFLQLVVTNLAPANPIESNILAPIIQATNNETWYGEDLVPTRLADLPASEQYDESTDKFSKWLGGKLDISPVKINYLLDQYSGGAGDVLLPMLTPEAESGDNSVVGNVIAPLKKKFTVDSVMNNQNVSDFYDTSDELTTNAKKSTATDEDVLQNKYINSVKAEMSELYKRKREIQNSDLTDAEKYEQVRELQSQIVALSKEGLKAHKGVSITGDYATVGDRHYKRNESGEWTKLTDKQLEKQEEVTQGLGISASEYWSNKEEYDYAYESPEKYAMTKALGGYETYKGYTSELNDIKADKDENGKSISGSRKEKVISYIDGLNADYGEKILLFKSEYPSDDAYNEDIIEYLNNREDISYSEMEIILKELGFTVEADGTIRW